LERILLHVEDTPGLPVTVAWTLQLTRALSSRLFAVAVVAAADSARSSAVAEERAWELLYGVEDDAFQQDVRVSLLLEQGDALERLHSLSDSYGVALIVASADSRLALADFVHRSRRPVAFVK
jgi:nucleotide-binding universal stress UspA family protein